MRQRIVNGAFVDMVTPDELYRAIPRPEQTTRVRAPESIALDASGSGFGDIYKVPAGYEFEVRRTVLSPSGDIDADPSTTRVVFAAGIYVAYLRSDQLLEYAQTQYGASFQVPGAQNWGAEQGPYLRNAEVFRIHAVGLAAFANKNLSCYVEGILKRPSSEHSDA